MHRLSIFFLCFLAIQTIAAYGCLKIERDALLDFKAGVNDPSNRLASWKGQDCCTWAGIKCSNQSGRIVKLNLQNSDYYSSNNSLSGEISPSLHALTDLKYLDLSGNNFSGNIFPKFICSFRNLKYLDLVDTGLSGMIPAQLSNLSKLQYLYLGDYDLLNSTSLSISNIWCLSHLTSLRHLSLSGVNLHNSREWVQALNMLPSLETLFLEQNNLTSFPSSLSVVNFTSLTSLSIEINNFSTLIPDWIGKLTNLRELRLQECPFIGSIPYIFGNLSSLNTPVIFGNYDLDDLNGTVPSLRNLHNLTALYLGSININKEITSLLSKLSNDTLEKLEHLWLYDTNLTGNLTGWLHKMPNLNELDISMNKLNGTIPIEIRNLTNLTSLDLSGNSFTGEISEVHLTGLSKLKVLDLSSNSITITINRNWAPRFQLQKLDLGSCKLGPKFPSWLHNQFELNYLNLSNTGIYDNMPNLFWNLTSLSEIDLSHNRIRGKLPMSLEHLTNLTTIILGNNELYGAMPSLPRSLYTLDLSNNSISGPLPQEFEAPSLSFIVLSNNLLDGIIGRFICGLVRLKMLDLSRNKIYGELPHCWPNSLQVVNLANNRINGTIPSAISSLNMLSVLQLNNNSLTGLIPSNMQFCRNLSIIDLGENEFHGQIPEWLGETLPNLNILRLRSNLFHGNIPWQVVNLTNLQVLDLAENNLSGSIPHDLETMMDMTSPNRNPESNSSYSKIWISDNYYIASIVLSVKGFDLEYSATLSLLKSIDLSGNKLTGEIPQSITSLLGLINLNLSYNKLNGTIPVQIGRMQILEYLDLRMNELSGIIPQSIANLDFLSILNVSYNNLSGEIPTGAQLQTFDPFTYIGNAHLCGSPLNKSCNVFETSHNYNVKDGDNNLDEILLYLFAVLGFGFGFWALFGFLMLKRNWRYKYFQMVDNMFDRIYVLVMLYFARLTRDVSD